MKLPTLLCSIFFVIIIASCQKNEPSLPDEGKLDINIAEDLYLVGGFASIIVDINTEQIHYNHIIDSLHPHVMNNFAHGVEFPSFLTMSSALYQGESTDGFGYVYPLSSIVEYTKNELSVKKIIASWNYENACHLTDSIYLGVNTVDSNYHKELIGSEIAPSNHTSTIFVNLLSINRYGFASININNPDINNYLRYKTSKFGDIENDSIDISSQRFKEIYGDAFCSSLMLGVCSFMQGELFGVNADSASQIDALKEAVEKIKIHLNDNTSWEELVKDSKYLKNSTYLLWTEVSSYGYVGALPDNYQEHVSELDTKYQMGEFSHYARGVRKYSDLYPSYSFVETNYPK